MNSPESAAGDHDEDEPGRIGPVKPVVPGSYYEDEVEIGRVIDEENAAIDRMIAIRYGKSEDQDRG
jgi:hypothetical protein